jgi:hypothetical protein
MKLEIEVDDTTGQPKDLPDAIKKHVDGLVDAGFKVRHGELRTKIEKELSGRGGDVSEAERARLKSLEEEVERHRIADAERKADYEKAQKIREDAEAKREDERKKDLDIRQQEITRRDGRLREMARGERSRLRRRRSGLVTKASPNSPCCWAPTSTSMPTSCPS